MKEENKQNPSIYSWLSTGTLSDDLRKIFFKIWQI
jgi:hypothetical protein